MATGGGGVENNLKADDFRHICSMCMELYGEQNPPKLLPCFHTFCLPCLTTLAEDVTTATPAASKVEEAETAGKAVEEEREKEDAAAGSDEETADVKEQPQIDLVKTEGAEEEEEYEEKGGETKGGDADGKGEKPGEATCNHGDAFLCPTCRASVTVPEGGVAALQVNEVATLKKKKKMNIQCFQNL